MDIELVIYQQIRTILESNAAWAAYFPEQNRIWYDTATGDEQPEPENTNEGDFPQFILRPIYEGQTDLFMSDETFQTWSEEGPSHWLEKLQFRFQMMSTSQLLGVGGKDQGRRLTVNAVRMSGPRLGLDFVTGLGVRWQQRIRLPDNEGEVQQRQVTRIFLSVNCEIDGPELLGA